MKHFFLRLVVVVPFGLMGCGSASNEVSDPCEEWSCANGGVCSVVSGQPRCDCVAGYVGELCDVNHDDCASDPCRNMGTCLDGVNRFQCMCAPGYQGDLCADEVDECAVAPCKNGASCIDRVAAFECVCTDGYAGPDCSQDIDDCASEPCLNDGECVDGVAEFDCECAPGFEGPTCETNSDDCIDVACENGGTCTDLVQAYQCDCVGGYEGEFCEIPPYWDLPTGYSQIHFADESTDSDGQTDSLNLTLPENSMSFTILTETASDEAYSGVVKLAHQTAILVKGYSTVWCVSCSNRVYASTDVATAQVPNSPDVNYKSKGKYALAAAQHTVSVYQGTFYKVPLTDTPMDVRVLVKHGVDEPDEGTLDLNLWFTEATGVSAADGPTHPRIVAMLTQLNEVLGAVGVTIGAVTYQDVSPELPQVVSSTLGKDSDLGLLFQSTAGSGPGTNIVFVGGIVKESLETPTTGIVLGIAGGIPGPPFVVDGSSHSGVAISWPDTNTDSDLLGNTAAHELGHYLGLFHSTEKETAGTTLSGMHDPISDTPEDDKSNLMWWASEGGITLSPGQGFVLLRHANVRLQSMTDSPSP